MGRAVLGVDTGEVVVVRAVVAILVFQVTGGRCAAVFGRRCKVVVTDVFDEGVLASVSGER